jgi:hypothetical protein
VYGQESRALNAIELVATDRRVPQFPRAAPFAAAAVLSLAFVYVINRPSGPLSLAIFGAVAIFPLLKLWSLAKRDPWWLAFALILIQLLDGLFFLSEHVRPIITYGLAFMFCLPALPALGTAWKARESTFRLYLLFCLWCLISVFYSIAPEFSLSRLVRNVFLFAAISACSLAVRKHSQPKPLMRALMAGAIAVTVITAASLLLPRTITWSSGDEPETVVQNVEMTYAGDTLPRFRGLFGNPNEVGELAGLTAGLILTYLGFADRKNRTVLFFIAIGAVGLAIIADSRSDLVGLAIGSALYLCWRYGVRGMALIAVTGAFGALLLKVFGAGATSYIWRGDVWSLTGRTDIWQFALREIAARPLMGYGWAVGGAIFGSKYFPIWWGPWDLGPHSSIHSGYLTCMVGVGIPATLFWLFIILRPWVALFRQHDDPWGLKRAFFFLAVPMLIINFDESMITDCAGAAGFLFMMLWALAEQYRLVVVTNHRLARQQALENSPPAVVALVS